MSAHGHGHGHGGGGQPSVVSPSLLSKQGGSTHSSDASHSHGHGHGHGGHSHSSSSTSSAPSKLKAPDKKPDPPAWPIFRKSLPYLWPRDSLWLRFSFIASLACLLIGSLLDLYTPIATKYAVDELSGNVDEDVQPVLPVKWILVYGVVRFLANLFQQLRDVFFAAVGAETERRVALETFTHLQSLSLSFHLRRETGSVLRSVSRGAQSFATLARIALFQILPIFLQLIVVCVYLAGLYPWYFSFLTFMIIALYFAFTLTTTNWRDRFRRTMNEADNEFNQKAVDALLNYSTIKHFNSELHEERRYDTALRKYTIANTRTQQSLAILNAGQNLIISVGICLALFLAARQVLDDEMTVGDFVMVQAFILQLYTPMGFLGTLWRMIKQSIVDVESMFQLLSEEKDIQDSPDAKELALTKGEVRFDDVSFGYDKAVPILRHVSFTVSPGKKLAIVGPSGAGKSTIALLLYRFYDVSSGRILIDGQDIRTVTQRSLRAAISIIPQDTVLFNDTLYYNISYGGVSRTTNPVTEEEVEAATQSASLDGFVKRQPEGFSTRVGERGLRLSGGEKQRVAIARSILKESQVVIFDEATSALDTQTELEIQRELDAVSAGRSSLTIAHRLSTIANSDLIIVLDQGVIAEQGTHNDLIARGGLYAAMWSRQERARALEGELQKLTEAEKAKAAAAHIEEDEGEGMFGERKDDEDEDQHGDGVGDEVKEDDVTVDVRDDMADDNDTEEQVGKKKSKARKKKGTAGDDLSAPLLL